MCLTLPFMRFAGISHIPVSKSNSSHVAPNTSSDLLAFKINNSNALAPIPSIVARSTINTGNSAYGRASWCLSSSGLRLFLVFSALGKRCSRLPLQAAGLSPALKPSLIARLKTASIRRLTRSAVSVLSNHIGSSICKTCFLSISETGKCPITGNAYAFKLLSHCLAVLWLVHSCSRYWIVS